MEGNAGEVTWGGVLYIVPGSVGRSRDPRVSLPAPYAHQALCNLGNEAEVN